MPRALVVPATVAGTALVVSIVTLLAAGADPGVALAALVRGAVGDRYALTDTLIKSCPLVLTGLAVAIAFRSGVWNIGAEGQLLVGALAATAAGGALGSLPFPLPLCAALAAGCAAGACWAWLAAALKVARGVSEVIATIMLNFVAVRLVGWAVHGPLREAAARYPQSDPVPAAARLPATADGLHLGILLAALLTPAVWALLHRTALGFRWRATGDNPEAARVAGLAPARAVVTAMLVSGALAGGAGAVEVTGVTGRLFEQFSGGQGYTAIAVALLARLHPGGVAASALFFGALAAGSGAMQRTAGVSAVFVAVVQATMILALLAADAPRLGTVAPGADHRTRREASRMSDAAFVLAASALALGTPLLFAALGELVSERAGIINIGTEGLMLTGAFAGMLGCWMTGSPSLGMVAACLAAGLLGAVFALFVVGLDADQVVAGAALNILALGATGVAYRAVFGVTGSALTVATFQPIAVGGATVWLSPLRQPAPAYVALALVPLVWVVLARTRLGLALRAVGEAPAAAASLGVRVAAVRVGAILTAAVLAGAGGGYLSLAYSNTFVEGMSAGRGFIALAIVVFGRWHPLGMLGGALLFGAASAGQFQLQAAGVAVSYHLLLMLPYVLTLAVLALASGGAAAPAALGRRREE